MPKAYNLLINVATLLLISVECVSASVNKDGRDSAKQKQNILVPDPIASKAVADSNPPVSTTNGFVLKPIIGLGVGMFSYFGNVKSVNSYAQNPTTSRLGYDLVFAQKLTDHFEFHLYALFGQLGQYVRTQDYNWNFQSHITGGGVHIMYKILPQKDISPYFILGLESYEFLSTTDMRDQYGNKYYYWSDGSIRSLPQNAANASSATIVNPDYTYETDIRSLNLDGSGKYSEQTFAIPIGAGFMIHVNKKADFTIGTTLHYTFTDHIDGLNPNVPGPLKGTRTHDMFLMTSIGLRYDLTKSEHVRGPGEIDDSRYDTVKLDASLINDTVHYYANTDTVPLSDSAIARQYRMFMDSTGEFTKVVYDSSTIKRAGGYSLNSSDSRYTVEIGRYSKGVPAGDMDKILSVSDVKSNMLKDSTSVYTAGDYSDFDVAKKRKEQLIKMGLTDSKVVYYKGGDYITTDKPIAVPSSGGTQGVNKGTNPEKGVTDKGTNPEKRTKPEKGANPEKGTETLPETGGIVYRVQLGAYKHKLSSTRIFSGAKNLVEVKTENGLYTYSAGSFTNYKDAAVYKTELITEGFSDAFVKAYKNGKRIALSDAGATYVKPEKENLNDSITNEQNTLDKKEIKFRVQLGVFKGNPPKEIRDKFKQYPNLAFDEDESGLTHFNVGPYPDYASAKAMKEKVIADGVSGAFVVAYFKDKPIPLQQAISILKE